MSGYLIAQIKLAEREHTDREQREDEYANGYCNCCGSDCGLDEDGNACGYCVKGKKLLEKEK